MRHEGRSEGVAKHLVWLWRHGLPREEATRRLISHMDGADQPKKAPSPTAERSPTSWCMVWTSPSRALRFWQSCMDELWEKSFADIHLITSRRHVAYREIAIRLFVFMSSIKSSLPCADHLIEADVFPPPDGVCWRVDVTQLHSRALALLKAIRDANKILKRRVADSVRLAEFSRVTELWSLASDTARCFRSLILQFTKVWGNIRVPLRTLSRLGGRLGPCGRHRPVARVERHPAVHRICIPQSRCARCWGRSNH
jgi:hypothetical protein